MIIAPAASPASVQPRQSFLGCLPDHTVIINLRRLLLSGEDERCADFALDPVTAINTSGEAVATANVLAAFEKLRKDKE